MEHKVKNAKKVLIIFMSLIFVHSLFIISEIQAFGAISVPLLSTINQVFPDDNFAQVIAQGLGKTVTDSINQTDLDNITNLYANNKNIADISGIQYLTNLKILDVSNNQLTSVPASLLGLVNLQQLNLSHNQLRNIPTTTITSPLTGINVSYNQIQDLTALGSLPQSIVQADNQAINVYLGNYELNMITPSKELLPQIFSGASVLCSRITPQNYSDVPIIGSDPITGAPMISFSVGVLGDNKIKVQSTNGLAPNSTYTASYTVISTNIPDLPVITSPVSGVYMKNQRPVISGTANANTTINIIMDGTVISNAAVTNANGIWSYTPAALSEGYHHIIAVAKNSSGQVSGESTSVDFTVDITPPLPPVITYPANGLLINTSWPAIVGTGEIGATVKVTIAGIQYSAIVDSNGNWSITPTIPSPDGQYGIIASQTDRAGNDSISNSVVNVIIRSGPNPTIIINPVNGLVTNNQKPVISGTSQPNSSMTVTIDGAAIAVSTNSDIIGNWSYTPTVNLSEGFHNITAKAANGIDSIVTIITVDITPPSPPLINSQLNGSVTNNQKPAIYGTAEPNSKAIITIDGVDDPYSVIVNPSGYWSYSPSVNLSQGIHKIFARVKDTANNVSTASEAISITVDTTLPSKPLINTALNNLITNNKRPVISGTAEPYSKISITMDDTVYTDVVTADSTGVWSYVPSANLNDGSHSITANAKDVAGNISGDSATTMIIVKLTAPNPPVINTPVNGFVTNTQRMVISGIAQANSKITVTVDGYDITDVTTADIIGNWSYSIPVNLNNGIHSITAKCKDAANNVSSISTTVVITVDLIPPTTPQINASLNGSTINNQKPVISGLADANSKVTVTIDGVDFVDAAVSDASGKWSYTPVVNLSEGIHNITSKAKDIANNVSGISTATIVTIDITRPVEPAIKIPLNTLITKNKKPVIRGTSQTKSKVIVTIDGIDIMDSPSIDAAGNWMYVPTRSLSEGIHNISVKAQDTAGNISTSSKSVVIKIDSIPPKKPIINTPSNNIITRNKRPLISGLAEANSKVILTINGFGKTVSYTVTTNKSGKWSYKSTTNLKTGTYKITAKAKDSANNISPVSRMIIMKVVVK